MIDIILAKVKGFILNPVAMFQASGDDATGTVFSYLGALVFFNAVLSAFIAAITFNAIRALGFGMWIPVMVFIGVFARGIIFTIIAGAWIHLWVYILGGRNGTMRTMKGFVYGMTPSLLLGWIPVIGPLFAIWSFILNILGIRELAGFSTGKAALVMIIAILIPVIIAFVFYFLPLMSSSHVEPQNIMAIPAFSAVIPRLQ
ncbi:YIP1 family protein [Methanoregula sp.]|uniref:YIP1 family protein n=1 Tax=Methanoregula sp. TaxID=2052170 RepID=UPI003C787B07